jgi:hypothetical protein
MPLANWLALIALLAIIIVGFAYCGERNRAKEAEGQRELAEGRTESAVEAIEAINDLNETNRIDDQQAEDAINEIRQAPPSERDRLARAHLRCLQHGECSGVQ